MLSFAILALLQCPIQSPACDGADQKAAEKQVVTEQKDGTRRAMLDDASSRLKEQQRLGKLGRRFLEVTVDRENAVIVTGEIASSDEAKAIMQAVSQVDGIEGIMLNLGINRQPRPNYMWPPTSWPRYDRQQGRRELKWDDGHWELDFDVTGQ